MIKKIHKINTVGFSININYEHEQLNLFELKKYLEECIYYVDLKISWKEKEDIIENSKIFIAMGKNSK